VSPSARVFLDSGGIFTHRPFDVLYSLAATSFILWCLCTVHTSGAIMSDTGAASCCAATAVDLREEQIAAAKGDASLPVSAPTTPVAKSKARAAGGRSRGVKKPQIDIDVEIDQAHKLAELFKKMQKASKVAARNAGRQRQRLVRKAQKLSEQDLMRLAVIKRCGMFVQDDAVASASAVGGDDAPTPPKKSKGQEALSNRIKTLVGSAAGAKELVQALNLQTEGNATPSAPSRTSASSRPRFLPLGRSLGPVLQRLPSRRPSESAGAVPDTAAADVDDEDAGEPVLPSDADPDADEV